MLKVRRKMERERVTIEFDGPSDEVGIGAFAATLFGYATVVQEAGRLISPSATVDLNVRAVRPGCVSVDVDVVTGLIEALRNVVACIAPLAPDIVATAAAFYRFKRDVARGGGVKEVRQDGDGGVVVTTGDRSTVTVTQNTYNLYIGSAKAGKAVSETFSQLDRDATVDSVSFGSTAGGEVRVDRGDFRSLADASPEDSRDIVKEAVEEGVRLSVVKPNLVVSAERKWGFVRSSGATINASISDEEFMSALPSLSFAMGTVMVVDLRKTQVFNRDLGIYMDKQDGYVVTKVRDVVRPNVTDEIPGFSETAGGAV